VRLSNAVHLYRGLLHDLSVLVSNALHDAQERPAYAPCRTPYVVLMLPLIYCNLSTLQINNRLSEGRRLIIRLVKVNYVSRLECHAAFLLNKVEVTHTVDVPRVFHWR